MTAFPPRLRPCFQMLVCGCLLFAGAGKVHAQATLQTFGVSKTQDYLQNSATTPISATIIGDPGGPFHFSATITGTSLNLFSPVPKITTPTSNQYNLAGTSTVMELSTSHATKSALDSSSPNGTYTFIINSTPLPLALGLSDTYPAEIPQVTNGTWDGTGKYVISAGNGATLNFNTFTNYTGGVGGIITFTLYNVTNPNTSPALGAMIVTVESFYITGYLNDSAITSYTISPNYLQADRTYYAELSYARITQFNTSFLPAAYGMATFMRTTGFSITTAAAAVAPSFTTQPAGSTVAVGANVTLTAAASGNPTPTYQWRKDGVNITGATLATYSLNNIQTSDAGSYTVVANNTAGQTTSNAAVLTVSPVAGAPTISTHPASQAVAPGAAVTFTVVATGTPSPTYQWRKDGVDLSGATSTSYAIASAQAGDAAAYTVVVTNSAGSVTSNAAVLTVSSSPSAPVITTQPSGTTVLEGTTATFAVLASGNPVPTYQWKKNGSDISGATNSIYTIASTVPGDEAAYTVVVTNSVSSITSNAAALVIVLAPAAPVFTTQPNGQTVATGSPATLTVVTSGNPAPTCQWYFNGAPIPGATSASYAVSAVTEETSGTYTVVATNSVGTATSNAAVVNSIPAGFDVAGYYARNADIAAAFGSDTYGAWQHFWNWGLAEGRQYDAQFIVGEYLLLNTDLTNAFGSDLQAALKHWLTYGKPIEDRIGRVPIGFNVDAYLARYPDLAAAFGAITPTAQRNVTVWNHYLDWGVREGRSDGDFEAYNYLATNADLAAVFGTDVEAAALHWYFYGRREGRRIPANFSVTGYRSRNPDIVTVWGNDLYGSWLHYRDTGVYEGRTYDDLFRVLEYRARYADVQAAYGSNLTGVLNHWLFFGLPEGRLGRNP